MKTYDVLCIGNAIVDVIASCDDAFLSDNDIIKGAMNLVDAERAEELYGRMGQAVESSGGSAGNTAAGLASFGARTAYFGKIAKDQLGDIYAHDIQSLGVTFNSARLDGPPPTARSMIFVTPDGERSMNTYLGACAEFGMEDIDETIAADSKVTYFEGYLWDPPRAKDAIRACARMTHEAKGEMAMTLSDPFCVGRYREEFLELMRSGTVDIVFANEEEVCSLYETGDFDDAVARISEDTRVAAITRSEKGSVIVGEGRKVEVAAHPIEKLVDTTGAGDLYAAGFLYGYTHGKDFETCGKLGSLAAGLVIQKIGPRLDKALSDSAREAGIL
ncbi:adenosine kinase [Pararhizobium mangrovi]|uniref:Adenosine kinase n=1 Tax=Pararhizobium mangrovi TaxID=2590452 RepID=A0A506UDP3_9HYPH|nr:adenosine kinase [Pararhizobium mangrovi]TPW29857.1 adenosine kinase [Pararhizobium mangrovi]